MGTDRKMVDSGVEWIGEVPEGWTLIRAKQALEKMNRPAREDHGVVTCFRDGEVTLRTNRRSDGFTIALKEHGYQGVQPGDLVIHAMDAFAGAIGVSDSEGKCSPVYSVCRVSKESEARFLAYYFRVLALSGYIESVAKGIRERSTDFRFSEARRTPLALPPLPEQQAIATFLDHHVGLIDRERDLIAHKIGLLKDKRKALIFECVTGKRTIVEAQHLAGVDDWSDIVGSGPLVAVPTPGKDDPFVKGGRLVDSGVDWIGEVPSEWRVEKLSGLVQETSNKNRDMKENNLLSLSYGRIVRKDIESNQGLLPQSFEGYNIVSPGDVVLRLTDLQNDQRSLRTALVTEKGIITSAYTTISAPAMEAKYFAYAMNACDSSKVFYRLGGGVRQSMRFQDIKQILIPIPDSFEQQSIATFLDHETNLIDREIELLETKSSLLADKRKALIFEAVTGKIDCTQP